MHPLSVSTIPQLSLSLLHTRHLYIIPPHERKSSSLTRSVRQRSARQRCAQLAEYQGSMRGARLAAALYSIIHTRGGGGGAPRAIGRRRRRRCVRARGDKMSGSLSLPPRARRQQLLCIVRSARRACPGCVRTGSDLAVDGRREPYCHGGVCMMGCIVPRERVWWIGCRGEAGCGDWIGDIVLVYGTRGMMGKVLVIGLSVGGDGIGKVVDVDEGGFRESGKLILLMVNV